MWPQAYPEPVIQGACPGMLGGERAARHSQTSCLRDTAVVGGGWHLGTPQPLLALMAVLEIVFFH